MSRLLSPVLFSLASSGAAPTVTRKPISNGVRDIARSMLPPTALGKRSTIVEVHMRFGVTGVTGVASIHPLHSLGSLAPLNLALHLARATGLAEEDVAERLPDCQAERTAQCCALGSTSGHCNRTRAARHSSNDCPSPTPGNEPDGRTECGRAGLEPRTRP